MNLTQLRCRQRSRGPRFFPIFALWLAVAGGAALYAEGPTGFTIDLTSREQSRVLYNTVYQASENVPSGWTGDVSAGRAGTTSAAFKDAVKLRVNYYRAMAGLPATVRFSDSLSASCQQAALMMSANNALTHAPPASWIDYTSDGANAAAHANLALGTMEDGPRAIDGYLADNGGNNPAAGHRRWILYPPETTMGTGDVDGTGATLGANALWILDQASFANPAPAGRDGFVAWPPSGWVPYTLVAPRWSFSAAGADFSAATVTMTRAGQPVPVRLESLTAGAGDNTLVWVPDNQDAANPPAPIAPVSETPVTVTVDNVRAGGKTQSWTYTVTPFDPATPGGDTVVPTLNGPAQPVVGAASTYSFNAVPNATGYRWQASAMFPVSVDLDAENGPGDVTIIPADTDPVSTADYAFGHASYQFFSEPPETMTLNAAFTPDATGSALTFNSRLAFASPDEVARVQISTDGGGTWTDLYTLAGASEYAPTEGGFAAHAIDLSAYAGKSCTLRLRYAVGDAGSYFVHESDTGWFVDDIVVTGAVQTAAPMTTDLPVGQLQFAFTPPQPGGYALQVTPIFYGQYAADAGPALTVAAGGVTGSTGPEVTAAATVPLAHTATGSSGLITVTRAGGDLSQKVFVHYLLKGSAVNGTDFATLGGTVKIKKNKASAKIMVTPLAATAGGAPRKLRLVLQPGDGYTVGAPASAAVKIKP